MPKHDDAPLINRPIEEFKGNKLIIGCGWKATGHSTHHPSEEHPSKDFYTIDINEEMQPDLVHDVTKPIDTQLVPNKKFDAIFLETYSGDLTQDAFKNIERMLSDNGACIIHWTKRNIDHSNIFRNMQTAGFNYLHIPDSSKRKTDDIFFVLTKNKTLNETNLLQYSPELQSLTSHSTDDIAKKYFYLKCQMSARIIDLVNKLVNTLSYHNFPLPNDLKIIKTELQANPSRFSIDTLNKIKNIINSKTELSSLLIHTQHIFNDFRKQLSTINDYQTPTTTLHIKHVSLTSKFKSRCESIWDKETDLPNKVIAILKNYIKPPSKQFLTGWNRHNTQLATKLIESIRDNNYQSPKEIQSLIETSMEHMPKKINPNGDYIRHLAFIVNKLDATLQTTHTPRFKNQKIN